MDLNHLHLHVRDLAAARAFYERHFGFREKTWHGTLLFLTNDDGFDLALGEDDEEATFPRWFHFGFRLANADAVLALHEELGTAAGRLHRYDDLVSFRCQDPSGNPIEVYWEL